MKHGAAAWMLNLLSYYSLYRVMSGQVFAATELPTSATVDVDSETHSELHYIHLSRPPHAHMH